jgi:hypothetical protein
MARQRIKRGILEFSTNPERRKLIKRWVIEVRCAMNNQVSHAYSIVGIKPKKDEC